MLFLAGTSYDTVIFLSLRVIYSAVSLSVTITYFLCGSVVRDEVILKIGMGMLLTVFRINNQQSSPSSGASILPRSEMKEIFHL